MNRSDLAARPYLRTPVLSPNAEQIAFVYASDIWLVAADGGAAERLTAHHSSNSSPRWTPDGQALAYCANRVGNGEIYLQPLDGSSATMLTAHTSASTPESWTPDGEFLYFRSIREAQGSALYRVARTGGMALPWLAQPYADLAHSAVSPDNSLLAVNIVREPWWRRGPNQFSGSDVWVLENRLAPERRWQLGGDYTGMNRWPLWRADNQALYVVSDRDGCENIWLLGLNGEPPQQITHFADGRVLWPSISADSSTVVFERNLGVWRLDLGSGEAEPLAVRVRTSTKFAPVRTANVTRELHELTLAPDGKKLAFIAHGEVFLDFADKETDKERRQGLAFRVTATAAREEDLAWSSDSQTLVYSSDRQGERALFRYDVVAHSETPLPTAEGAAHAPRFSPDGKWLAYARGSNEIRLIANASSAERLFVQANFTRVTMFSWSPDSRWLVFVAQDAQAFVNLYVQHIDAAEAQQISFLSNHGTYWPLWSPDGTFVIATTRPMLDERQIMRIDLRPRQPLFREDDFEKLFGEPKTDEQAAAKPDDQATVETPSESVPSGVSAKKAESTKQVEIVFEGIDRRLTLITRPQLDAVAAAISPDSRDVLFFSAVAGKSNIWSMPLDDARADLPARQITSTAGAKGSVQFAPDGKSMYYTDAGSVIQRKFPGGDATSLAISAEARIDFHQEKLQVFDEAWRKLRDLFFDATFRGLDWAAVRAAYLPFVVGAQSYTDLRAILNLMIGELRASHTGVYVGGDAIDEGYLGMTFDPQQAATGRLVVATVLPEGPAALAGIVPGEELQAVEGQAIDPAVPFESLLQRTVGQRLRLRLTRTDCSDHSLALRPIGFQAYDGLRYREWVETNERYVHRVSDGQLGYVHIRKMNDEDYRQLLADIDAEMYNRVGIVVDLRYNQGGHIFSFILDVLSRRRLLRHGFRDAPTADSAHFHGNRVLDKPTILLVNQQTYSNGEIFAEGYRQMGLGKIVGRPTAGAVISTHSHYLLNGAMLRVPQYRVTTVDGHDLEGIGRPVDIAADLPLGASALNNDPQLDAAVSALRSQLERTD